MEGIRGRRSTVVAAAACAATLVLVSHAVTAATAKELNRNRSLAG
jgi:hypothetical protein